MRKLKILKQLTDEKIVAVVRGDNEEEVVRIVDAIIKGGINIIEITYTIPNASKIIYKLSQKYEDNDEIVVGAGTCLDDVTTRDAILSGAEFIVSPHFDKEILKMANNYSIPVFPGATTVKDMVNSLKYGADIIKLFPGNNFGPEAIKTFKGPLPQANFMPTGGVNSKNLNDWLKAGAVAVGTGGSLTKGAAIGDYESITKEAEKLVKIVKDFKK